MIRPTRVETRPGYHIWLEYSDGVSGEVDLSYLVGRGIFKAWDEPGYFERVHITSHRSIAWNEEIELCPDAMYMRITGKTFEEMYADTQPAYGNA